MSVAAILAAAGRGSRLGRPKQMLVLDGKPIAGWSLDALARSSHIDAIIVACEDDERGKFEDVARSYGRGKVAALVSGGARRQDSVYAALRILPEHTDFVVVHDGARPFASDALIERCLAAARETGAAIAAVSVKDTIKRVGEHNVVTTTYPREQLWAAQTPQVFGFEILLQAHERALQGGFVGTDDAMLVEWANLCPVMIVEGSYDNIKITTQEDLFLAAMIAHRDQFTESQRP